MGWAWQRRGQLATRARDVLYPVLIAGLIYGFRSDALTQIKDVLYPMLLLMLIMGWFRLPAVEEATTGAIRPRAPGPHSEGRGGQASAPTRGPVHAAFTTVRYGHRRG
jgi:hypothetical protein